MCIGSAGRSGSYRSQILARIALDLIDEYYWNQLAELVSVRVDEVGIVEESIIDNLSTIRIWLYPIKLGSNRIPRLMEIDQ